jgi:hypothetical protein
LHAVVFCVDEKTAIQALDRKDRMSPLSPGGRGGISHPGVQSCPSIAHTGASASLTFSQRSRAFDNFMAATTPKFLPSTRPTP